MGGNCRVIEAILAALIIIFALWETAASIWIVVIAAALLLIHALFCKKCVCMPEMGKAPAVKKAMSKKASMGKAKGKK